MVGVRPIGCRLSGSPEEITESIRGAINDAELMAGCTIKEAYLSLSGRSSQSFNSEGMTRIKTGKVRGSDIRAVVEMAEAVKLPPEMQVLHVVPQEFIIDGQGGINSPLGMSGVRLELRAQLLRAERKLLSSLRELCKGLRILDVVPAPLAQAELLLSSQSQEMGVVLVDLGAESSDLSIFLSGSIAHMLSVPLGGELITQDIKECLSVALPEADRLKREHGLALSRLLESEEQLEIPGLGGRPAYTVSKQYLCAVIEARLEEIFKLLEEQLARTGYLDLPGGVVLTGGSANLGATEELARQILGMPCLLGKPRKIKGLVDVVKNPRYTTATGLILFAARGRSREYFSEGERNSGIWQRLLRTLGLS